MAAYSVPYDLASSPVSNSSRSSPASCIEADGAALDAGLVLVALDAGPSSSASGIEAARRASRVEISPEVSRP
ncbi:hypothetical protein [Polyangium jinanense]|uniref:Uncharacterized protein n=1 Tax=Polyangium jinanense TaxID=2829994 RepID=A0A9X3XAS8_9BACT|nr:hypothetical protein [Polyangium jinanense]MDC3985795.1 hypothetical protein [Polyangium jinanense]